MAQLIDNEFGGTALIADPIHRYIQFTVPEKKGEVTEKALIDSPWVQRLRYIYQLQSARWVYPAAEHSRFQHSLGAMHMAGEFGKHLYPSLRKVLGDECPSAPYIEQYMRVVGLLHDIGHGPFGHFFDDNFLRHYDLTHEDLGQTIIQKYLGDIISGLRRSPSGPFAAGEELRPEDVAFPIKKNGKEDNHKPKWVRFLQPLTGGIFTFDNLDYVSRDSYMCGIHPGPVDRERLLHYTFFTPKGLTVHKAGNNALTTFLNARLYLYTNVYYHRTTRAIDLHLRDIFPETMKLLFPGNPLEHMDDYLYLTDWSLLEEVSRWRRQKTDREALGKEWETVLHREVKWKMAFDRTLSLNELHYGVDLIQDTDWEKRIRAGLPTELRDLVFRVDMATQDPRPENPFAMGKKQIHIYDPSSGEIAKESLAELFEFIPSKIVQFRVFALNHDHDRLLSEVAENALKDAPPQPRPVFNPRPMIPIVDLRAQYAAIRDQIRDAIDAVAESQQFILGPAVNQFETEMAAFLGCQHAVGVASGSDALLLALMAIGVGPGDAVITTPFTFFSTVSSITRLGATPLFVDIDSDSYLLSPAKLSEFLGDRGKVKEDQTIDTKTGAHIKALLPVHLFGQVCDIGFLVDAAKKYRLQIVEDVAQACGARLIIAGKEMCAGTIGDLGCFSFFPSKNLGSFGDGGLVSARSKELAGRLRMLRMHGESTKYHHDITGLNSRLDSLQAAVLSVKLQYLDVWCEARIARAQIYHRLFMDSGLVGNLVPAIPLATTDKSHVFNNYCIRAERRDELKQFLAEAAIQSEIYYPLPLHLQKCFADLGYKQGDFPDAELAADQVLALPLYPELTAAQQETVVAAIAKFYRR